MYQIRSRTGFCVAVLAIAFVCLAVSGTTRPAAAAEPGPNARAIERVMAVQDRHAGRLMAVPGVVGTATGINAAGKPVVKVFTVQAAIAGIPANLEGERVVVQATGPFFALAPPPGKGKPPKDEDPELAPTSRWPSPVPIGVSTGNEFSCSAGTIGCKVKDDNGGFYALSNVHVFDPWHYGEFPDAVERGERIVQPGRLDDPADDCLGEATPENIIGKVVDSVQIDFTGGPNYVDAAIANIPMLPDDYPDQGDPRTLGNSTPSDGYGTPSSSVVAAELGQKVQKYGRTTALTKGQVTGINATVNVGYDVGTALFVDQIIVESRKPFLKAGDSGSLLVTQSGNKPTGLLFAGNGNGKMAVANHIDVVLLVFGVSVDGE